MGVETESQAGCWAGLLQTLVCYWAPTSHQNLLAGQGESQGPGPVLFRWPSVLGFPVCSLGYSTYLLQAQHLKLLTSLA